MRLQLEAWITLASGNNFWAGFSQDVSTGGVFLRLADPPPIGTVVLLRLAVGDASAIEIEGEVRWIREDERGIAMGCGVQFRSPSPVARMMLQEMLRRSGQDPLLVEF